MPRFFLGGEGGGGLVRMNKSTVRACSKGNAETLFSLHSGLLPLHIAGAVAVDKAISQCLFPSRNIKVYRPVFQAAGQNAWVWVSESAKD